MMKLKDKGTDVTYMLSDLSVISVPKSKMDSLPNWDISIVIDKPFVDKFIKGAAAIDDNKFTIICNGSKTSLVLGYSDIQTNRVTIDVNTTVCNNINNMSFSAKALKEIFSANPDFTAVSLNISEQGVAFIHIDTAEYDCKYFLLALTDVN